MTETNKTKEEKKVISIYQINTQLNELNKGGKNAWENLQEIVETSKYNPEIKVLKNSFLNNYDVKCYKLSNTNSVGWKNFVEEFLEQPLEISSIKSHGILLLIKPKNQFDTIYAITFGNLPYFIIQNYIDTNFGLDILSRIIASNTNAVKSAKGQNVVGSTQGQLSIYRQLHSLSDIEDFGRIFQELNASITKEALEKFGIETEKDFKNCCAKSSFQIKTSIPVVAIEKYIQGCEYARTQPAQPINSSRQLDKKKEKELIDRIITSKIQELWQEIQRGEKLDLCHKDFDKYINANSYKCKYNRDEKEFLITDLLADLLNKFAIGEQELDTFLKTAQIMSYNDENQVLTQDKVIKHLFLEHEGEYECNRQKYFILNGDIYQLQEPFLESLNDKIKKYKSKNLFLETSFLKQWEKYQNETDFNNSHKKDENTIVIHPYTLNNIELCDLIKYNEKEVYLFFVKDGFEGSIRDLSYQVYNTAKIIETDINSNYKYLEAFYDAFSLNYPDEINLSKLEFIELFKLKNIKYVFAFRDKKNRSLLKKPEAFGSNIAKFALIDLVQKMNFIDNGALKIEQIECV